MIKIFEVGKIKEEEIFARNICADEMVLFTGGGVSAIFFFIFLVEVGM